MVAVVFSVLNNALLALILWRAHSQRVFRVHPFFYVFIAFQLVFTSVYNVTWATIGQDEIVLPSIYSFGAIASQPLHIVVLLQCLAILGGLSVRNLTVIAVLGVLFSLPAYSVITSSDLHGFGVPISLAFQIGIWAFILWYVLAKGLSVGPRMGGILAGLLLISWLEGLAHLQFSRSLLDGSIYRWLVPLIYTGALLIFWFSLNDNEPAPSAQH